MLHKTINNIRLWASFILLALVLFSYIGLAGFLAFRMVGSDRPLLAVPFFIGAIFFMYWILAPIATKVIISVTHIGFKPVPAVETEEV